MRSLIVKEQKKKSARAKYLKIHRKSRSLQIKNKKVFNNTIVSWADEIYFR